MAGTTNWIWLRHASAGLPGRFCGQSDPPLDDSVMHDYGAMAERLPSSCGVILSPLRRAVQTLERLDRAGLRPNTVTHSSLICEQHFGEMEGAPYESVRLPETSDGLAAWRPPGGESFVDVIARVRGFLDDARENFSNETICVIAHAGVIRAALAIALEIAPVRALGIAIDPLSATALTQSAGHWQVRYVNRQGADL